MAVQDLGVKNPLAERDHDMTAQLERLATLSCFLRW